MSHNQAVLDFNHNLGWEDLPTEVAHQAKRALLDNLGVLVAGYRAPVAGIMAKVALSQMAGEACTIYSCGKKASLAGAVMANGFVANALDMDDGHKLVKGHPGACLLPVVLAALELKGGHISGRELIAALVAGYELGIRAGMIRHDTYPSYHSTGSWGALSAAACLGKLMGDDPETIGRAMGAAEYHAPIAPMMKGIAIPAMVKDSIGWGAMVGALSLKMARLGFTGINPLFDDAPDAGLIAELGRRWRIMDLYFKPYAGCRWAQPAIAATLEAMAGADLRSDEVARVEVFTFGEAAALSCAPPENTEEAQYNLAYGVAAAVIDGEVGPSQVLEPRIFSEDLRRFMARVEVREESRYQSLFPERRLARVRLETVDGRVVDSGECEPIWDPPDSLPTDAELSAKFMNNTVPVLGEERGRSLHELIMGIENRADCAEILKLTVA